MWMGNAEWRMGKGEGEKGTRRREQGEGNKEKGRFIISTLQAIRSSSYERRYRRLL